VTISGISAEFQSLMPILYRLPIPPLQYASAVFDRLHAIGEISIRNT
jgi:hypothetical protein